MSAVGKPFDPLTTPIGKGITLVEASAGTGKTHCLSNLVVRLLLDGRADDITRFLVVTFTNAATDELVTRVRGRLQEAIGVFEGRPPQDDFLSALAKGCSPAERTAALGKLRAALRQFDEVSICTIHSFCKRALDRAAFESGSAFNVEITQDERALLEQAAMDFWRRQCYPSRLLADLAVSQGWNPNDLLKSYSQWKRQLNAKLLPETPPLPEAIQAVDRAFERVRSTWDRARIEALMSTVRWNKNNAFSEDGRQATLDRLDALCKGDLAGGFDAAGACTPDALKGAMNGRVKQSLPSSPFIDACSSLADAAKTLELSWRMAYLRAVDKDFDAAKRRLHALTFDDLLSRLHAAVTDQNAGPALCEALRRQYQVVLIDEFQDTDPVQCEIFTTAFAGGPLVLVGDPKQAIYSFRGADVFAYLRAKKQAGPWHTLLRNWRSDPDMVAAVNALFDGRAQPFVIDGIPFEEMAVADKKDRALLTGDGRPALQWWFLPPKAAEAKGKGGGEIKSVSTDDAQAFILERLTAEVLHLLQDDVRIGGEGVKPGDIAVLARSHRQAAAVQERLREARIPSVISNTGNILDSREMQELERFLRAMLNPQDGATVRAALATELWDKDAHAIAELNADDAQWQRLVDQLNGWHDDWLTRGFMPMMEEVITDLGIRSRLLAYEDGERRLTNLLHAAGLIHEAIEEEQLPPDGVFKWLARARSMPSEGEGLERDPDRTELRLESDAEAVQIVTVHKSKGLQYGIVFCPFLWDGHNVKDNAPLMVHTDDGVVFDCGPADSEGRAQRLERYRIEQLAESVRLAYVALTRAKHRCYVAWGAIGQVAASQSGLGYLLHQPPPPQKTPGEGWIKAAMNQIAGRMGEWQADLQALVDRHPKSMAMELLDPNFESKAVWRQPSKPPAELRPAEFPPDRATGLIPWVVTSYSGLTARKIQAEQPDYDDRPITLAAAGRDAKGIFGFGRGPQARLHAEVTGICLHGILERCSFGAVETPETDQLIRGSLEQYGLQNQAAHAQGVDAVEAVREMLRHVLTTPLPGAGFSLSQLQPKHRMSEWRFDLPLDPLSPPSLAGLFAKHASARVREEYARRLSRLRSDELHGYLSGFVDLAFEHQNRWYIIDWKSNHLGDKAEDYDTETIWTAMLEHDYVLQYHLYIAALDRFLRTRLTDYDYDRDFGGVWYVFLRGVDGTGHNGFYFDRPPKMLIDALNDAIHRRSRP
jgi:exodeoxyribonuclease V beta subunit